MRLYLIRHGETPWNVVRRLQGQSDITLNDNGRALARVTARALRKVPFDLIISSPLKRAVETAQIVTENRDIPLICDSRISEISFGVLEGERYKDDNGTVLFPEFDLFFHKPECYIPPEGGESIDDLLEREAEFIKELCESSDYANKTILISSHGAGSRAILANIKQTEKKDFWGPGVPPNCAVSIIEYENGTWNILEQDVIYYENVGFLF